MEEEKSKKLAVDILYRPIGGAAFSFAGLKILDHFANNNGYDSAMNYASKLESVVTFLHKNLPRCLDFISKTVNTVGSNPGEYAATVAAAVLFLNSLGIVWDYKHGEYSSKKE